MASSAARSESVLTPNVCPYGLSWASPAVASLGSDRSASLATQPRGFWSASVTSSQGSPLRCACSAASQAGMLALITAVSSRLSPEAARKDSRRMPRSKPRKLST